MGIVYEADDLATGTVVALKVSAPDAAADVRARRRLTREADAGKRIDSPHVARALETGEDTARGLVWIAFELAAGATLDVFVREHYPLSRDDAARLLAELGAALAAAHAEGIVHRDLKPENIRVEPRPEGPFLRVLDFGIAKSVTGLDVSATAPGLGTPLWVAPEQSRDGYVPAPSADVWAYGLIAFFVLTGKLYWKHANDRASLADLALEIMKSPIEPASVRARALGVATKLPHGFDAWFERAVARDVNSRFKGGAEAARALAAVLGRRRTERDGPVVERPLWLILVLAAG
jgi:serine/threonine-protein kinase